MLSRRNRLLWVLLASLAIRIAFVSTREQKLVYPDSRDYDSVARSVLAGEGFREAGGRQASRAPGYPMFLAACYWMGLDRPTHVYAVQALVGALMCVVLTFLAMKFYGEKAGAAAGWIGAFYPFFVYFTGLLLAETLFMLGLVGFIVLLATCGEALSEGSWRKRLGLAVAAGLVAGLVTHVRSSFLLFPLFVLPFWLLHTRARGKALAAWGAMLVTAAIVMSPWVWRNYQLFDHFVPTTLQVGESLYEANSEYADGGPAMDRIDWLRERDWEPMGEYENNAFFKKAAIRYIREHPGRFLRLAVAKQRRFWNPVPNFERYRRPLYFAISLCGYVPVMLLALIGIVGRRGHGRRVLFLLSPVLYYAAMHAVFVGSVRYRVPVMPFVIVLAGGGAALLRARFGEGAGQGRPSLLRRIRWGWCAVGAATALGATLWWGWRHYTDPVRLRAMAVRRLGELAGEEVSVGAAELRLSSGLSLTEVAVTGVQPLTGQPAFRAGRVVVRPSWSSLLEGALVLRKVEIEDLEVNAELDARDRWRFLRGISFSDAGEGEAPVIVVANGRLRISRADEGRGMREIEVPGLNATFRPADSGQAAYAVEVWSDEWSYGRPHVNAEIGRDLGSVRGRAAISGLVIESDFRERLPQELRNVWDKFSPSDVVLDVDSGFSWERGREPQLKLKGEVAVRDGSFQWEGFPYRATSVRGAIRFEDGTFRVDRFKALAGGGLVSGSGKGRLTPEGKPVGEASFQVRGLRLDRTLYAALPAAARSVWDGLRPSGRVNVLGHVAIKPDTAVPEISIEAELSDCALAPPGAPGVLRNIREVRGRLLIGEGAVSIRGLAGNVGKGRFTVRSSTVSLKDGGPFRIRGRVSGLSLDGACRELFPDATWDALPATTREFLAEARLKGGVDIGVEIQREPEPGTERVEVSLATQDVAFSHPQLGRPLTHVRTRAHITRDSAEFEPSTATWGLATIETSKTRIALSHTAPQELHLRARKVPLDHVLYNLMSNSLFRNAWDACAPGGTIDEIELTLRRSAGANAQVTADGVARFREAHFCYVGFPYPVRDAVGTIELREGAFQRAKLDGSNGPAKIHLTLQDAPLDGREGLSLLIRAEGAPLDEKLRTALPAGWQDVWDRIKPEGTMNLVLEEWFDAQSPAYRCTAKATVSDVTLDCGFPVAGRWLDVEIENGKSDGAGHETTQGRFHLPELTVSREELQDVDAKFLYDSNEGTSVRELTATYYGGKLSGAIEVPEAPPDDQKADDGKEVPEAPPDDRKADDGKEVPEAPPDDQKADDGKADAFHADFSVTGGDLAAVLAPRGVKDVTGRIDAKSTIQGHLSDPEGVSWKGEVTVEEGAIGRLPGLLKLLNPAKLQPLDEPAFHTIRLDYEYRDRVFYAHKLDLIGDAVSLYGKGAVTAEQRLDFQFIPEIGPWADFPVVGLALKFLKERLSRIELSGKYDDPKWRLDPVASVVRFLETGMVDLMLKTFRKKPEPPAEVPQPAGPE